MRTAIKRLEGWQRILLLTVLLGIAIRLTWMSLVGALVDPVEVGEAANAARAFARGKGIADAFFPGQGPTAHLLPTTIVIAGTIERLLGPGSVAADLGLSVWTLLQTFAAFGLTALLFRRVGADRATIVAGIVLLSLMPAHIAQEAADFRVWEGALAACLGAANLWWIATLADRATVRTRDLAIAAMLFAVAFFVSPPVGLAVSACWALHALSHWPLACTIRLAAFSLVAVALLLGPWTLRNQQVMGEPIWLRSNFGLEVAIANHPLAVDPAEPAQVLATRSGELHPFMGETAADRLRADGGEIAYSRRLMAETWSWIASDPGSFARLTLRHYRQFYLPDGWQRSLTNWPAFQWPRIVMLQIIGVLGLMGLAIGLWRRRRGYAMLALYVGMVGLPYAIVQPIPRYSYVIYPVFVFVVAGLAADIIRSVRTRRRMRQIGEPLHLAPAAHHGVQDQPGEEGQR